MSRADETAILEHTSAAPLLKANGKILETRSQRFGWLTPTPADLPLAALKEQYQEQGYLWLKGLLDPAEVREFRGYVFRYLAQAGLILAGSDPRDGISAGSGFEKAEADRQLMALVRCAAYEAFCVQPRLWRLMDPFLGGLSYLHKRKLMRYTQPQTTAATPAHYDLIYLRGGTTRIVTA